jgi:hypothetical protein
MEKPNEHTKTRQTVKTNKRLPKKELSASGKKGEKRFFFHIKKPL